MKKKQFILIFSGAVCLLLAGIHFYFHAHPIQLKSTDLEIEVNSKYNFKDNLRFIYFGNEKDVSIQPEIDTSSLNEYDIFYQYKDYKQKCHIRIVDTTPPVLKLKNYKTDLVEKVKPEQFIESCKDYSDCSFKIMNKNTDKEGKTEIIIFAVDSSGNETKEKCTLTRIEDTKPPVINNFQSNIEIYQGESYDFNQIQIEDDMDPDPDITIEENVDFTVPDTYKIKYIVQDRSGNKTEKTTTLLVKENKEANMKVVYLTFDDGPSYNTEKVLDILKENKVKATFFVTGNGQNYNHLITRAYNEGHTIGLHTYSHNYEYVYSSTENYFNDLNQISDMVYQLTGNRSTVIRFPGGSSNTVSKNYKEGIMSELSQLVQSKGYQYYDWNVSSGDAAGHGIAAESIIEQSNAGTGDKIMLLFHDAYGKDTTVEALDKVIKHYKKEGYVFKPITKGASYVCHHGINN